MVEQDKLQQQILNNKIIDASELLHWCIKNKSLQINRILSPLEGCFLNDIRIKDRNKEDKFFLNDEQIYSRIRRGNCISEYTSPQTQTNYKIVRKGMIKFYDYLKSYPSSRRKEEKFVLDPVNEIFNEGTKKIAVYISEKANGENAQIAFDPITNAWIVGSKNVTILCRSKEDTQWYKKIDFEAKTTKFAFCIEFANLWFEFLEREIISKERIVEFINEISGYTLICENVGLKHQHIKLYTESNLIFYAMIQNDSYLISESPKKSFELFHKYSLNYVSVIKSPIFDNFDDLKKYIDEIYVDILKKDVEIGGEGSVAYFTSIDGDTETVVSMGKLKTFEYRFLRKLREKLKSNVKNKNDLDTILHKIEKESNNLLGEDGDMLDLSQWMEYARFVLEFVNRTIKKIDYENLYASFTNEMKELYRKYKYEKLEITNELVKSVCEKFKLEDEKNEDSQIQINSDIDNTNISVNKNSDYYEKLHNLTSKTFKIGGVYFFLSSGLVGGGKSTLFKILENLIINQYSDVINIMYISSDKLKENAINDYQAKIPSSTFKEAYDSATNTINGKTFTKEVIHMLESHKITDKINIFYIDKNFPSNHYESFCNEMKSDLHEHKVFIFHPHIINPIKENGLSFPFSLSYFIQCYYRIKGRSHETLDFEKNPNAHHVLIGFLAIFGGFSYHKIKNKINYFYPLTFSDESHINYPEEILKMFLDLMKKIGKKGFDRELIKKSHNEIDALFKKIECDIPHTLFRDTRETMVEEMSDFLNSVIYGKVNKKKN